MNKKIIVVLGMHRSGTSAVTRGLHALGVNLGDNLVPPLAGYNDKGFFEDIEIMHLNEELMAAIGSSSAAQPLIRSSEFKQKDLIPFKRRAVALIRDRLDRFGGMFAFKDPRTARLLPFWKEVFEQIEADVCYLLVARHPASVASSLQKLGIAWEKGCYLWLNYVTASVLYTENQKRLVVDYDLLMDDPETQLKRMADAFSLVFDPASPVVSEYTGRFLENDLRHTRYHPGDSQIEHLARKDLVAIYHLLAQMSRDALPVDSASAREAFLDVRERLVAMNPVFFYMDQLYQRLAELELENNRKLSQMVESVEQWQRSSFRRIFHRWHMPGKEKPLGFFRRLRRSITKRLGKEQPLPFPETRNPRNEYGF